IVDVLAEPANQSRIFTSLDPSTYKLTYRHLFLSILDFKLPESFSYCLSLKISSIAFWLSPSWAFFLPRTEPRRRCADSQYSGRGCRRERGGFVLPSAADSASATDARLESFPEYSNRTAAPAPPT